MIVVFPFIQFVGIPSPTIVVVLNLIALILPVFYGNMPVALLNLAQNYKIFHISQTFCQI